MAMRGSPARRIVGNPLGSVLSTLDRRTRVAARRRTSSAPREQDPAPAEGQPVRVAAWPAATLATTGEDGRAQWVFPQPYGAAPAVMAVAVDPAPEDEERTVVVALEEVTTWCVTARVWRTRGRRGAGVAEPAGAGVHVHLTAQDAGPA